MTTGFMCYIHEGDVIRGVICSLYMDTAWYSDLASRSISLEYDIITQPAMRYLAFAISSDNASWEVLHVQDTQNVTGMASVTIPDTYDGTVKLGLKLYDTPPTLGSILNVGFDYVTTGGISVSTTQNGKTVTMTCATQGAVIRYTVDGSDPTEQSTEYAGEFVIDHDCTVKAKAWKDGLEPSDIVSKTVEIPVVAPQIEAWKIGTIIAEYHVAFVNNFDCPAVMQVDDSFTKYLDPSEDIEVIKKGTTFVMPDFIHVYELNDSKSKRTCGWDFLNVTFATTPTTYEGVPMDMWLMPPIIADELGIITITNKFPDEVEHTYYKIDDGNWQEYTEPFQMTASGTVTAYCIGTGYENSVQKSLEVTVALPLSVGDIVSVDGIETLVLAVKDDSGAWVSTAGAQGTECIGVDKNHDLCWYVTGSDYVDSEDSGVSEPTYGYQWQGTDRLTGGGSATGIQDTAIGTGLTNTNSLIEMDLPSGVVVDGANQYTWTTVWDVLVQFRQSHSNRWFVPSKDEADLIFNNRSSLENLSTSRTVSIPVAYWTSTEYESNPEYQAWMCEMRIWTGLGNTPKNAMNVRTRLCVQFNASDIDTE